MFYKLFVFIFENLKLKYLVRIERWLFCFWRYDIRVIYRVGINSFVNCVLCYLLCEIKLIRCEEMVVGIFVEGVRLFY